MMMSTDTISRAQDPSESEMTRMKAQVEKYLTANENLKKIKDMIGKQTRLTVDIDHIRKFDAGLANFIVKNPLKSVKLFEDQLNAQVGQLSQNSDAKVANADKMMTDASFPKKT